MKPLLAALCLLGIASAVPAFAQNPTDPMAAAKTMIDHSMTTQDANGDGMISSSERAAASAAMFKAADTNGDGMLTQDEILASSTKDMAAMHIPADPAKTAMMVAYRIKAMDTNGDGKVSMDEMDASSQAMFAAADANKDGSVSRQEMTDMAMARMKAMTH